MPTAHLTAVRLFSYISCTTLTYSSNCDFQFMPQFITRHSIIGLFQVHEHTVQLTLCIYQSSFSEQLLPLLHFSRYETVSLLAHSYQQSNLRFHHPLPYLQGVLYGSMACATLGISLVLVDWRKRAPPFVKHFFFHDLVERSCQEPYRHIFQVSPRFHGYIIRTKSFAFFPILQCTPHCISTNRTYTIVYACCYLQTFLSPFHHLPCLVTTPSIETGSLCFPLTYHHLPPSWNVHARYPHMMTFFPLFFVDLFPFYRFQSSI